jgi:hypothetical protein
VSSGPAVSTPLKLTYTPSDVPRSKSVAVAVVQNVGPDAVVLVVSAQTDRAAANSARRTIMRSLGRGG